MKSLSSNFFIALLALLTFAACKKEQAEPQPQFDQAEASVEIREIMEEMDLASQAVQSAQAQHKLENPECVNFLEFPECATVTIEPVFEPVEGTKITVQYGDGCIDDGEIRMGMMVITILGIPEEPDFSITTEYADYFHRNKLLNGSRIISKFSEQVVNKFGQVEVFQEDVSLQFSTVNNGRTVNTTIAGQFFIEWTDGLDAGECGKNKFTYHGSRTKTVEVSNGKSWNVDLSFGHGVLYDEECGHFVSGIMTVTKSRNNSTYNYNFGDGTCDDIATLSINGGRAIEISMLPVNL